MLILLAVGLQIRPNVTERQNDYFRTFFPFTM